MSFWECLTHKCGSSKFNNLSRHEMPSCDIRKRTGIHIPSTWCDEKIGGLNGDVSRKFYKEWDKLCLDKQQKVQIKNNWTKQIDAYEKHLVDNPPRWYS